MKIKRTLTESTTVSKIFFDVNTGKYYRVKGHSFVEVKTPGFNGENDDDPNNDEYNPEQDEEDEEEDDEEPIIVKRDTFEFDDDEDDDDDEENDPDDPDETHRPGVIVHNKADGKDYVWNKKLKKYIRFK